VEEIKDIDIDLLAPMEGQPRVDFREIDGLASSIASNGQLVPIIVANIDGKYVIVEGERRYRASKIAGIRKMRCQVIQETDKEKLFSIACIANFARLENSPMEIARAFKRMSASITIDEICVRTGKSKAYIDKYMSLLNLHEDFQKMLDPSIPVSSRLPLSSAIDLSTKTREEQESVLESVESRKYLRVGQAVEMATEKKRRLRAPRKNKKPVGQAVYSMACSCKRFIKSLKEFSEDHGSNIIENSKSSDIRILRETLKEIREYSEYLVSLIEGENEDEC
jgi:ParB family chromosome partitioning protein